MAGPAPRTTALPLHWLGRIVRFRLRTLLIVVTVLSVLVAVHVHNTRRQRQAVAAINDYGGWVRYDYQFPSGNYGYADYDGKAESGVPRWLLEIFGIDFFHRVVQVNLNYSDDSGTREENSNDADDALEHVAKLPNLRILLLANGQATDATMHHLAECRRLERLYMWDAGLVSDAGVQHLANLKQLRYVHIGNTSLPDDFPRKVTDESLRVFGQLPLLEGLSLQGNSFTDAGLAHLTELDQLEELWVNMGESHYSDQGMESLVQISNLHTLAICGDDITDAGLAELAKLEKLKWLMVDSEKVTPQGEEALVEELPQLKVE